MQNSKWLDLCIEIMGAHIDYHWGNLSSMAQFKILSTHSAAIVDNAYSEQLHNYTIYDNLILICNI